MLSRRSFLRLMAASGGLALTDTGAVLGALGGAAGASVTGAGGISHVVILMLENRSFDHILGWVPGADGNQARDFPAPEGLTYPNYPLAPDYQGCGYSDPDHSWEGWLVEGNHGAMDGFLMRPTAAPGTPGVTVAPVNTFPIGYYTNLAADGTPKAVPDVPVLGPLAQHYTLLDRYFSSFAGETYPNRFYQHAGRTDRDHNSTTTSVLPTIWDQLVPAVSATSPTTPTGAYYFKDIPFLALWGSKYVPFWRPFETGGVTLPGSSAPLPGLGFLDTITQGLLPNVSFVDPSFESEDQGTSGDYHPLCDIRVGEKFVSDVYHALSDAGYLSSTVLVITFDEWGGFFDHVLPPTVTDTTDPADVDHTGDARPAGYPGPDYPDYTQLGYRVPAILVSDYAPAQVVHDGPYEHASSLAMIESIFGLKTVGTDVDGGLTRDAFARDLSQVLSTTPRTDDPSGSIPRSIDVPGPATGAEAACTALSVPAAPPDPVGPVPDAPEFGLPPAVPVGLVGTAGLAALGVHLRRKEPALAPAVGPGAGDGYGRRVSTDDNRFATGPVPGVGHATDPALAPTIAGTDGAPPSVLTGADLIVGEGPVAPPGGRVEVHYVGAHFATGETFDSSWGRSPATFPLDGVIAGFRDGIAGMRVGGRRVLVVPPDQGYGAAGVPGAIPGGATLVFVVDLLGLA